ncbi:MAG: diguanylate cyclase [Gammaproteobacteria bacterium]|nr:diguanylate cyclase [Gammaproteobacteria bacterium]
MHEQAAEQPSATTTESVAPNLDKPWVLVVDDSRVIRRAITKALTGEFNLIEAEDGEAAWQRLVEDERVQVIITDMEMPKLDGYSLICRIRAAEPQRVRDVPVIVITGAQDEQTRERAYACGATDFVTKPLDSLQLLARTRAHARLDETTRKLTETTKSLEDQTAVDPVTELHSRRYFLQRAAQDVSFAKRHGQDLAVVRVDFDNFRAIYKQLGDDACDKLFVWLANIIRSNTRTEDTPARIRGGEFAILAPNSDRRAATVLCERLRSAVAAQPFNNGETIVPATISLGLATLNDDRVDTIDDLLARAEQRLTLAKAAGGNQLGMNYADEVTPPEEAIIEEPTLEAALQMLQNGEAGKLVPYLPDLASQVMPLLDACDQQLDLDLAAILSQLREKLGLVKQ